MISRIFTVIVGILPFKSMKPCLLNWLGHCVSPDSDISVSILLCKKMYLDKKSVIGKYNILNSKRLVMRENALIGTMNYIRGDSSIWLKSNAEIGNRNKITRGYVPGILQPSQLRLGAWSKLTADHAVDVGSSVLIGENTVIGGLDSQIWTHGFVHQPGTIDRIYIGGKVRIGSGCFIGSRSCLSAGAIVGDNISIGAQSSVAGTLTEPGAYVSQKLRHISSKPVERISSLKPIEGAENAYRKVHDKSITDRIKA